MILLLHCVPGVLGYEVEAALVAEQQVQPPFLIENKFMSGAYLTVASADGRAMRYSLRL